MRRDLTTQLVIGTFTITCASAQMTEQEMQALAPKLPAPAAQTVNFQTDIRPLFDRSCLRCHGPEKPKGGLRLDSKVEALKGGHNGPNIVPGKSASSSMSYYVAHLVEDMEMPPPGKGERFSAQEVGLLRAWIDQGAVWPDEPATPKFTVSVTPVLQFIEVRGDERKFGEHTGLREGFSGGSHFRFEERIDERTRFTADGKAIFGTEDYQLRLYGERKDAGFVRFGWEQSRYRYDDTGGWHPGITPPSFDLGRDLELDAGRAYLDFGLTLPDWPRMVFGYELQYRDGEKSTLQWGDAGSAEDTGRLIYPAAKQVDEQVHIFKFDLAHVVEGISIDNNLRAEIGSNETSRELTDFYNTTNGERSFNRIREDQDHLRISEGIRLEKQVTGWLLLTGGYYYSHYEGDFSFAQASVAPVFFGSERFYNADRINLDQDVHIFNANAQFGSWSGLTIYTGAQSEWMSQRGFGRVNLDEIDPLDPTTLLLTPAVVDSDYDRMAIQEYAGLRFTSIPRTVLFAEGRLQQEEVGQSETQSAGTYQFMRDTDASGQLGEARTGFTLSPWTRVSFTGQYKIRHRDNEYDRLRGETPFGPLAGYPTFITDRETETDTLEARLAMRPTSWLRTTFTYQLVSSNYETTTESLIFPGPPDFNVSPGGSLRAGNHDSHVVSANVSLTPWQRLYLSGTLSYRESRISTWAEGHPEIDPYKGETYSVLSSGTYILNDKTDLYASYNYSWSDYGQNNYDTGLPVGLAYDWHVATIGLTRKWRKNLSTSLQYRCWFYDEGNMGGSNNYQAHAVLASLNMLLQ